MLGLPFARIVCFDFEFNGGPGERPNVVCLVAKELRSGRVVRQWFDGSTRHGPPFPVDRDTLYVAYFASADVGCFLALGWPLPIYLLDPFTEFRCTTNGIGGSNGLLDALIYYGLDTIGAHVDGKQQKDFWRDRVLQGAPFTIQEVQGILDYCQGDVEALARLLPRMLPGIRLDHALHRGRCMIAAARMEHAGVPVDRVELHHTTAIWEDLKIKLVNEFDPHQEIYDGVSFNNDKFAGWLIRNNIAWPRLADNPHYEQKARSRPDQLDLQDETFRQMARVNPLLAPVHELRASLSKLRLNDLQVGADARNRTILSPYRAKTGRFQPSNSRSIVGPARWIRGFIKPPEGYGLAYLDYAQQEFGIAAALSGDGNMLTAYEDEGGDPYIRFAVLAGALPQGARRDKSNDRVESTRNQFKALVLATQYGMTAEGLARRAGMPVTLARDLMWRHRVTFPTFWRWSDRAVRQATLHNVIHTVFGWPLHIAPGFNPRSLRNFPMQANGAEMLRLACCLATERGVEVCMPVHDAMFIAAPIERIDEQVALTQACMREASREVLAGYELRSDAKVVRWPDRYMDKDGAAMWDKVTKLRKEHGTQVDSVGQGKGPASHPPPGESSLSSAASRDRAYRIAGAETAQTHTTAL